MGPLIALIVAGLLALVMRWVFGSSRPRIAAPVDASDAAELGLLTVIATGLSRAEVATLRDRLSAAGVRSSSSHRHDATFDVLVFSDDVERARLLLD